MKCLDPISPLAAIGAALFLCLAAGRARATYRSDFFNASHRPTIAFDKSHMTWTLRNQAIERVVRFDVKPGRLQTTAFRALHTRHALLQSANGEGEFTFVAALAHTPTPLVNWKMTEQAPPADWAKPAYNDAAWKPVTLPYKTNVENRTWWFRCTLPPDAMKPNRAYALLFDHAIDEAAEIYVDGVLTRTVSAAEQAWDRTVQVDILPTNQVVAVKLTGGHRPNGLVNGISLAEVGSAPPPLDLSSDWQYSLHTINTNDDGSQTLTISLLGINKHEGFDLDVNYQIYPGEEPTIVKWFSFVSHRQNSFLVEQVVCDRWALPGAHPETQRFPGTGFAASDPITRDGLFTAVLSLQGSSDLSADGREVAATVRPYAVITPNMPQQMPRAMTGYYHGPTATGAFLYQLYIGAYVAHATPDSVPVLYNTWFGYQGDINAQICEKIIPLAQELGVKLFVIDDGWQKNVPADGGKYGDWIVDRRADKFPEGLLPISNLVREHKMNFGLWTAPIMVNETSQVAMEYPNWLLLRAAGVRVPEWPNTVGMCFASGWGTTWGGSMVQLCRELAVSFLKLDSGLYYGSCMSEEHEHPIGHAASAQELAWTDFCAKLRKLNPDFIIDRGTDQAHPTPNTQTPNADFSIDRGWEQGPEATAIQDEGWFGDWEIGYDPKRQADAAWWYKNADIDRATLYDLTWTRPSFTIARETPCHIPTATPDLNALEYHFTSVGAYICNVELHGKLDQMTPEERALMQKWVRWNTANRPWLAYTQPLASLGRPTDPRVKGLQSRHIDGVLHLRNALQGRYGYVCLWNPAETADSAAVAFDPADYYVRLNPGKLEVVRLKDGKPVRFTAGPNGIALDKVEMAPRSWEIYELRGKGKQ